jgi:hypothetical protein
VFARLPGFVVALVILTAGVGAGVALARTTRTRTVIYQAFTSSGAPAIHVKSTVRGTCNGGSSAIDRADAWRCFAGNGVYDPCFSSTKAKGIVLCPDGPWTSSGVEIKLTAALTGPNKHKPSTSGDPWAVETTSGAKCEISTGATTVVDGQRANYFCLNSKDALWGNPSRKSEPWTILAASQTATKLTSRVKLSEAWF